jgi:peptidyl-prolyl cis-trans isomerase C
MRVPVITVALLVAGLCAALPSAPAQAQVVATVDGKPITEADLRLAEREVGAGLDLAPEERRRILVEAVIQRQALAAAAEQAKLDAGQEFEERLAYARRSVLQRLLIEKHAKEAAAEADARRIYGEQSAAMTPEEEVRVRHILVDSQAVAEVARTNIMAGADFAALARALSADQATAPRGGDLGWRTRSELPVKLAAAAFALQKPDELSAPVPTDEGWHILRLEGRRLRTVPEFAVLKDHIIRILVRNKAQELARDLRRKVSVTYLDPELTPVAATDAAPRAAPPAGTATAATPAPPAPVAAPVSMSAAAKASYWLHDGSRMKLLAEGERVVVQFETPRGGLDDSGIASGTLLFQGSRHGKTYTGEAYAFAPRCGARAFAVTGESSPDDKSFSLRGSVPVVDAICTVEGTRDDALVFEYAGPAGQ